MIDDFRTLAEGGSELGVLDAPSFLATLFEWVVTSYSRAFDEVESQLEEFDVSVLDSPGSDTEDRSPNWSRFARASAGCVEPSPRIAKSSLRSTHPELDLISTERSAERFEKLTEQVDVALAAAREAKDAVVSSFDVVILRTEHRTNEIVKMLTLASILLLPGALIAGVMGMNVNFSAGDVRALTALLGRRWPRSSHSPARRSASPRARRWI